MSPQSPAQSITPLRLEDYDVSEKYGFLPTRSPALSPLPTAFQPVQAVAAALPKWMTTGTIRQTIAALPEVDIAASTLDEWQRRRVMQLYSYLTHAYVWGGLELVHQLPHNIAVPFCQIAEQVGRPPVLSYASYALDNWIWTRPADPVEIGNIWISQNFLGGLDEDWFILVHIEIEAKAAPALAVIPPLMEGVAHADISTVIQALSTIKTAWDAINQTMRRMPEGCDPYIYYHRVRPYIHAWKNNPALPEGLIYEGVYGNQAQLLRGETGAQSSIVPTMDALFQIEHEHDLLWNFLQEMRSYMPPKHRAFVVAVEERSTLREFVQQYLDQFPQLRLAYDNCITAIEQFRTQHLEFAARYIHKQAAMTNNDTSIGTGGTPFMPYLKKHRDESRQHLLSNSHA